ncbi:MAG: hypothetical protein IKA23_03805, partial [Akkermansia sp.]|nr:hypothetical protein [Akkermansia sp.]
MKTSLACTFSLFALGGVVSPLVMAAPAAEMSAALPAPEVGLPRYYGSMTEDFTISVSFPVPMVPAGEVGKPVKPGVVKLSHADAMSMVWQSTSMLQIKPVCELPVLEVFTLEVPAGVKGLKGEPIPPLVKKLGTSRYFYGYSTGLCDNGNVFLRADKEKYADVLKPRLAGMYYEVGGKRYPVVSRPATVADAVADWDAFRSCTGYQVGDEDREAATSLPQDELIPNTWVLELPGALSEGGVIVRMPGLRWDEEEECFGPGNIVLLKAHEWKHVVTNTYKAPGKYELELKLDMPAAATTPEELIRQFEWGLVPADATVPEFQKMEWRDGALRAQVNGQEVVITPQKIHVSDVRLPDGSVKPGSTGMTLLYDSGEQELKLRTVGLYEAVVPVDEANRPEVPEDVTSLRPRAPYIYTDVC